MAPSKPLPRMVGQSLMLNITDLFWFACSVGVANVAYHAIRTIEALIMAGGD